MKTSLVKQSTKKASSKVILAVIIAMVLTAISGCASRKDLTYLLDRFDGTQPISEYLEILGEPDQTTKDRYFYKNSFGYVDFHLAEEVKLKTGDEKVTHVEMAFTDVTEKEIEALNKHLEKVYKRKPDWKTYDLKVTNHPVWMKYTGANLEYSLAKDDAGKDLAVLTASLDLNNNLTLFWYSN